MAKQIQHIPFAFKWIIDKNILLESAERYLHSEVFEISKAPLISCNLELNSNVMIPKIMNLVIYYQKEIKFHIKYFYVIGNHLEVIKSFAKRPTKQIYKGFEIMSFKDGTKFFTLKEIFNPKNQMLNGDGKLEIKLCGICSIEKEMAAATIPKNLLSKNEISSKKEKDFSIVVIEKKSGAMTMRKILINKEDFKSFSPVFFAMLNSGLKEAIENKLEIINYPFEVVETAMNFCYGKIPTEKTMKNIHWLLLEFSDYYNIQKLKDFVLNYLIGEINENNVKELFQISKTQNFENLQKACLCFLVSRRKNFNKKIASFVEMENLFKVSKICNVFDGYESHFGEKDMNILFLELNILTKEKIGAIFDETVKLFNF